MEKSQFHRGRGLFLVNLDTWSTSESRQQVHPGLEVTIGGIIHLPNEVGECQEFGHESSKGTSRNRRRYLRKYLLSGFERQKSH